jgi:hypothetical protein
MPKNVVGLFEGTARAEDAIKELQNAGFERDRISVIANEPSGENTLEAHHHTGTASSAGAGAVIGGIAGLVAGLGALAIPGIGPIIVAGPLAVALGSAGVGAAAGGMIGALTGMNIPESDATYYAEGIRSGRTLVAVETDDEHAERAREIMDTRGAQVQEDDPERTNRPDTPQVTLSGARVYMAGLEMNPRKSRFEDFEHDYRADFEARNLDGHRYESFSPAYRYGHMLAHDARFANDDWLVVEDHARREWEERNPGTWEQVRDMVRYSWKSARS